MSMPELTPVATTDLDEFCRFLSRHLDSDKTPAQFRYAFEQDWGMEQPNHGFVVRKDEEIVGAIGAIYAERSLGGNAQRVCNITSWCVLEAFRPQSMRLALAVCSQEGFSFTDLTPTEVVAKSLQFLKFRPLNSDRILILNVPRLSSGVRVEDDPERIVQLLPPQWVQVHRDHCHIPWLHRVALETPDGACYLVFKRRILKGLPSAEVLALSDGEQFLRGFGRFAAYTLGRWGMVSTRVESRFLPRKPPLAKVLRGYRQKMFRSEQLAASDIDNLYSEIVALDL
jgi:hypothetical protein